VVLRARLQDGQELEGETSISAAKDRKIVRLSLVPAKPTPLPETLEAIQGADVVVVGPGSLYTSVIPNLLVDGMAQALTETQAVVLYVCNVMTQAGETDGMTCSDHLAAIIDHVGCNPFDYCVMNDRQPRSDVLEAYRREGAVMVRPDSAAVERLGSKAITADLLSRTNLARHDHNRLAATLLNVLSAHHAHG
jgi:uncharacterized cofD-like protein